MRLWDKTDANARRWDEMRAGADREVRRGLKQFLASEDAENLARFTTHPEGFLLFLRDFSFLCYATIHHAFEDPSKWDFEEGLTGLDLPGYMQLLSTCHARNALVLTPKYDEFFLQSALWAAAWMYRRSDTYIEGWRGYYTGLMIRVGSERLGIASAQRC